MKLNPWQTVAALAVLFAAIICAYVFAPAAVTLVVGMATTAFAGLVIQKHDGGDPPEPPTLTVVDGGKK